MKNEQTTIQTKGKRELPHIFAILLVIIVLATICTWVVPAGTYVRYVDESGRTLIDPDSFQYVDSTPVGPFAMFVAIEEGLIQSANITFLILMAFSSQRTTPSRPMSSLSPS